jgi:31-O-methyltransferase
MAFQKLRIMINGWMHWGPQLTLSSAEFLRQSRAPRLLTLPGGRDIWCTSPAEAGLLWRSMASAANLYRRAARRLSPADVVLDIGANVGLASICFADVQPDLRIVAVEPSPDVFTCLERNVQAHLKAARAVRAAVSDEQGSHDFVYYPNAPGNSGLYANHEKDDELTRTYLRNKGIDDPTADGMIRDLHQGIPITVPTTTISQLMHENSLENIALIKIDVERAELDVLHGIGSRDWDSIGSIAAEVHDEEGQLEDFCSLLQQHGYELAISQERDLRGTGLYEVEAIRVP